MRRWLALLVVVGWLGSGAAAHAATPTPGIYTSTDLGGLVLTGHGTNSWSAPLNGAHGLGDVFNSQSWDGSSLGTQWIFECGVSPAAQTVQDNRIGGTGTVVFTTTYMGGTFFLDKNGRGAPASVTSPGRSTPP